MTNYDDDTERWKLRRLDAHTLKLFRERSYVSVEEVGTRKRVYLTDDGEKHPAWVFEELHPEP